MGEDLFTILFILFFILASVLDAVGRRRKKKRRMEEMEREEARAEERGGVSPRSTGTSTSASGRREEGEPAGARAGEASGTRETADSMVPEDLWAILTGQKSPEEVLGGRDEGGRVPGDAEPEPPREPHIPAPVPSDRMSAPGEETEVGGAPRRRGDRWMEGTEGRGESERWAASVESREAEADATPEEPWEGLEAIAAGDLTDDAGERRPATPAQALPPPARGRRRRPRSRYVDLLTSGNPEDLKKAVVLREVLDRPVGFRTGVGPDWE